MIIKNANVFMPDGRFAVCDVRFTDVIEETGSFPDEKGVDATGLYLLPGLIDVHTHGAAGCDFSDGIAADMGRLARHYAVHGVTSFLATTMTLPEDALLGAAAAVGSFTRGEGEAKCAGIHLEGPFLSYEKRGAQCADFLIPPDAALFDRVNAASGNIVREITVAPETEGAIPFIREKAKTCAVSVGHTVASYECATEAFRAGASQLTHTYNGMCPLAHRAPGALGAGMDASAFAELICDGLHVHPAAIRAAFRLFPNRVVLISDSLRCAGLPDGEYDLGTQAVTKVGGRCTLTGTDTLAGSVITVYDALVNVVRFGIPLETAVAAATINPARAVRLTRTRGSIRPGLAADLLLLDSDLSICAVFIDGKRIATGDGDAV